MHCCFDMVSRAYLLYFLGVSGGSYGVQSVLVVPYGRVWRIIWCPQRTCCSSRACLGGRIKYIKTDTDTKADSYEVLPQFVYPHIVFPKTFVHEARKDKLQVDNIWRECHSFSFKIHTIVLPCYNIIFKRIYLYQTNPPFHSKHKKALHALSM